MHNESLIDHWSLILGKSRRTTFILMLFLVIFATATSPAYAACNFHESMAPGIKDITNFTSTCTITAVEGIDNPGGSESSTTNTAVLTLGTDSSITINNGGQLVTGSMTVDGGTVAIQTGGVIKLNTPMYVDDSDADGWPTNFTLFTATSSGRRRLGLMRAWNSADCGQGSFSVGNSCGLTATGGTITTSGGNTIHTFTSSGTFTVTAGSGTVNLLVVGGGGSGGTGYGGSGGGGGGGQVVSTSVAVTAQAYTITIGDGALAATTNSSGTAGQSSSALGTTAVGGGGGTTTNGATGGTGANGGGGASGTNGSTSSGGSATAGYGGGGGNSGVGGNYRYLGGGGGGAGAIGGTAALVAGVGNGGNGGIGVSRSISGSAVYYGGGGGGGVGSETGTCTSVLSSVTAGTGGNGGGGAGSKCLSSVTSGTANTGGGGGGGSYANSGSYTSSGAGGSGVVIISYSTPQCVTGTYYADADGDGYGAGASSQRCPTAGYVANNTDCYDSNANAYPGSSYCSGTHRGDNSYDYNCSNSQSTCGSTYYSVTGSWGMLCRCCGCAYYDPSYAYAESPGGAVSCGQTGYLFNGAGQERRWCSSCGGYCCSQVSYTWPAKGTSGSQACQ